MRSPFSLAIANAPMFGRVSHAKLSSTFPLGEDVWNATRTDLLSTGIEEKRIDRFLAWRTTQDPLTILAVMEQNGIRLLSKDDVEYPALLSTIFDPPAYLFAQGESIQNRSTVAMVGSRHCTTYGKETAHSLSNNLAHGGISIVSGGAYGIDSAAHEGAMAAKGHTIAVLASGLLGVDNTKHTSLFHRILESGGTLLSEFPLISPPTKSHFPLRNRIVSGMCQATIIVEAALASGSMITAMAAMRENRDVCAIPGNITSPTSSGTNFLIKDGAHCITSAEDVFQLYGMHVAKRATATATISEKRSASEKAIFAVFGAEPLHIDVAAERALLSPSQANIAATQLEILGIIRDVGGKYFVKNSRA